MTGGEDIGLENLATSPEIAQVILLMVSLSSYLPQHNPSLTHGSI